MIIELTKWELDYIDCFLSDAWNTREEKMPEEPFGCWVGKKECTKRLEKLLNKIDNAR